MLKTGAYILFFLVAFSNSVLGLNNLNSVSIKNDSLLNHSIEMIEYFNLYNRQKELNAYVTKKILQNTNFKDVQTQEILFYYFKNLLNAELVNEAKVFIDSLKFQGFFGIDQNAWKYEYWSALCDFFAGNEQDALLKLDKTLEKMDSLDISSNEFYGEVYYYQGLMWQYLNQRIVGLPYYLKAIEKIETNKWLIIEANRRISSTYSIWKNHKLALYYNDIAINMITDGKEKIEINDFKNFKFPLKYYADLLQSRAYAYREFAKETSDKEKYLTLSLNDCEKSIEALELHKRNLVFESDVMYLNTLYKVFYAKTIEAICRLHEVTGNDSLLFKALRYSEMDKVSALVYTIQRSKALYNSDIPKNKIAEIELLNRQLSEVEAARFEQQANIRLNDTALFDLNMRLYDLVSAVTAKEQLIEKSYPKYNKIKYDLQPPNLDYIFELSKSRAIVEYVVSDEKLYTFVIVDGQLHFNHVYFPDDFLENIDSLQGMISDVTKLNFSVSEQNRFTELSGKLYDVLLRPFEKQLSNKPLLIVPDGQLSLIPFEILVKNVVPVKKVDYASIDYLIKHHNISYAYSLTLTEKQIDRTDLNRENRVFAMAPGYKNLAGNQGAQYIALRDARDNLGMLKGARKEVKMVGKMVMSKTVFDDAASENMFKTQASKYSVLHLAMHTLVNNEDPLYSKLVFTPDVDVVDDGLLNTYELANMEINADLVVLSACNTGFGKLNQGEGIIGLSRGFFQAGCKSLLATLWSVSDESSLSIIDGFYENLRVQKTKSESLSASKREYLNSAKGMWAHPFFWAGYISIGDDEPLMIEKRNYTFHFIGLGLVVLVLAYLIWIWRKKSRK